MLLNANITSQTVGANKVHAHSYYILQSACKDTSMLCISVCVCVWLCFFYLYAWQTRSRVSTAHQSMRNLQHPVNRTDQRAHSLYALQQCYGSSDVPSSWSSSSASSLLEVGILQRENVRLLLLCLCVCLATRVRFR